MKLRLLDFVASFMVFSLAHPSIVAIEQNFRRQTIPHMRASQSDAAAATDTKRRLSHGFLRDLPVLDSFFEEESTFWLTRGLVSMSLSPPENTSMHPTISPSTANEPTTPVASTTTNPWPTFPTVTAAPTQSPPLPQATLTPTVANRVTTLPTSATYSPSWSKSTLVPTEMPLPTFLPTSATSTLRPSPSGATKPPTAELPPASSTVDTPSISPSSSPNIDLPVILMCSKPEEFLVLAQPPFDSITAIPFKIIYMVESSNPLEEYVSPMELNILEAAAAGALQCNTGGPLFGQNCSGTCLNVSSQSITTVKTGQLCEPEVSECTVFETTFDILVDENVDPEVSAFLGYVLLRETMDGGDFILDIPQIDRVQYLSPLPLLPLPGEDGIQDQPLEADGESSDQVSVSPWTLGTVVTMSLLGTFALGAWLRNRRNRNQRHQNLLEEMSVESPGHSTQV